MPRIFKIHTQVCLNPCSCGRWSQRHSRLRRQTSRRSSLNPCSCGRWSQSFTDKGCYRTTYKSLNPCSCGRWSQRKVAATLLYAPQVLILVLVEDGLRVSNKNGRKPNMGLNPCSCGRWSQSLCLMLIGQQIHDVLILVLVEDGLRG